MTNPPLTKQDKPMKILLIIIAFVLLYIWHYWKLESTFVNGMCLNESFGYHSIYGLCDDFKRVKYMENGSRTWYEVPLDYYLENKLKFDLPFNAYKLFRPTL